MTELFKPTPPDSSLTVRLARHSGDLLVLAWPVMLSRAGILVMAFVDVAMLGRYAPGAVGVLNLGLAIFVPVMVMAIGLASGMVPVVSQAYGAGNWQECGRAWRRALCWATFVSLIGMAIVWRSETLLRLFGQTEDLAVGGGAVAIALVPGLWAQAIFAVCAFYLEATRRPLVALMAMIAANVVNFGLNWVMIYGNLGFPEMGAVGAALASTVARFSAAGLLIWVILSQRDAIAAGIRGAWETAWGPGGWRAGYQMRKLGFSAGLSNGCETFGFGAMMMFAGTLGTAALDAYAISHNLVSTLFMVGLGLAVATGVRVGQAIGSGAREEAALAGWTGFLVTLAIMTILAGMVMSFRDSVAFAYTDDPAGAARAAALFMVSAVIFIPDCLQVVMGQAVRGLGDAWVPIGAYILSFIVVMIPLGYWLTSGPGAMDERGLAVAVIAACVLSAFLLAWRFWILTKRLA